MEDAQSNNEHQLWVNLSALGDGNIFAILPQLMQKMLESEDNVDAQSAEEAFDLVLPSDNMWQTKIYYKLVEKQRMADAMEQDMQNWIYNEPEEKLHDWLIRPKTRTIIQCSNNLKEFEKNIKTGGPGPVTWTVKDIAKAGGLLINPPLQTIFEDEQEMRRVYTLIYDVFRYKNIMMLALNDIQFFSHYPQCENVKAHVWLLFYDLYHRNFKKRETNVLDTVEKLFFHAKLLTIDNALWKSRTKLAAAVSRLRIQHSALSLNDMLPGHLKDERITAQATNSPFTCWVNSRKIKNMEEFKEQIENVFNLKQVDDINGLGPKFYKCDNHCPQVIIFHGSMRTNIAKSELVKNCKLIVQDKSFCLGPATFFKQLSELELTGSVIQTHINSPRTTAYLANVLNQNEKIKNLMAFSAGERKPEYESYFDQLGINNVIIFADRLIDVDPDAEYMEEVVAVFATPPNTYSSVKDPIDLVCSRGGDLSILEILTESEESQEGANRVYNILDEQKKTLKFAMSRPQIQFVLYETHSELNAENDGMVQKTINEINKIAKLQHASVLQQAKPEGKPSATTIQDTDSTKEIIYNPIESNELIEVASNENIITDSMESIIKNISIPETDIFDLPDIPSLCPSDTSCMNFAKEGCFLALLQRKKVIRLDNKYMIQMAENRGLFGQKSSSSSKNKNKARKKVEKTPSPPPNFHTKRHIKEAEIIRIAIPTHTFLRHTQHHGQVEECSRCRVAREKKPQQEPIYKKWWMKTSRHLTNLRTSLVQNKIIPDKKNDSTKDVAKVAEMFSKNAKIDEIVAKSRGPYNTSIPIFPKLKLERSKHKITKETVPVTKVHLPMFLQYVQESTKEDKA